jgi:hypothetical protein
VEKKEAEPQEVSKPAKVKSEKPTEPPDPNVATDAAPPTEVTSEASMETTLTPTAAEKNPAEDKPEEAKEEVVDEPMGTFTKPVVEDKPATDTPPPPVATEASPILEPGGHNPAFKDVVTTHVVIPEQNRKTTKNNQAAQVQETYSKVGASLKEHSHSTQTPSDQYLMTPRYPTCMRQQLELLTNPKLSNPVPRLPKPVCQLMRPAQWLDLKLTHQTWPAQDRDSGSPWTSCP